MIDVHCWGDNYSGAEGVDLFNEMGVSDQPEKLGGKGKVMLAMTNGDSETKIGSSMCAAKLVPLNAKDGW